MSQPSWQSTAQATPAVFGSGSGTSSMLPSIPAYQPLKQSYTSLFQVTKQHHLPSPNSLRKEQQHNTTFSQTATTPTAIQDAYGVSPVSNTTGNRQNHHSTTFSYPTTTLATVTAVADASLNRPTSQSSIPRIPHYEPYSVRNSIVSTSSNQINAAVTPVSQQYQLRSTTSALPPYQQTSGLAVTAAPSPTVDQYMRVIEELRKEKLNSQQGSTSTTPKAAVTNPVISTTANLLTQTILPLNFNAYVDSYALPMNTYKPSEEKSPMNMNNLQTQSTTNAYVTTPISKQPSPLPSSLLPNASSTTPESTYYSIGKPNNENKNSTNITPSNINNYYTFAEVNKDEFNKQSVYASFANPSVGEFQSTNIVPQPISSSTFSFEQSTNFKPAFKEREIVFEDEDRIKKSQKSSTQNSFISHSVQGESNNNNNNNNNTAAALPQSFPSQLPPAPLQTPVNPRSSSSNNINNNNNSSIYETTTQKSNIPQSARQNHHQNSISSQKQLTQSQQRARTPMEAEVNQWVQPVFDEFISNNFGSSRAASVSHIAGTPMRSLSVAGSMTSVLPHYQQVIEQQKALIEQQKVHINQQQLQLSANQNQSYISSRLHSPQPNHSFKSPIAPSTNRLNPILDSSYQQQQQYNHQQSYLLDQPSQELKQPAIPLVDTSQSNIAQTFMYPSSLATSIQQQQQSHQMQTSQSLPIATTAIEKNNTNFSIDTSTNNNNNSQNIFRSGVNNNNNNNNAPATPEKLAYYNQLTYSYSPTPENNHTQKQSQSQDFNSSILAAAVTASGAAPSTQINSSDYIPNPNNAERININRYINNQQQQQQQKPTENAYYVPVVSTTHVLPRPASRNSQNYSHSYDQQTPPPPGIQLPQLPDNDEMLLDEDLTPFNVAAVSGTTELKHNRIEVNKQAGTTPLARYDERNVEFQEQKHRPKQLSQEYEVEYVVDDNHSHEEAGNSREQQQYSATHLPTSDHQESAAAAAPNMHRNLIDEYLDQERQKEEEVERIILETNEFSSSHRSVSPKHIPLSEHPSTILLQQQNQQYHQSLNFATEPTPTSAAAAANPISRSPTAQTTKHAPNSNNNTSQSVISQVHSLKAVVTGENFAHSAAEYHHTFNQDDNTEVEQIDLNQLKDDQAEDNSSNNNNSHGIMQTQHEEEEEEEESEIKRASKLKGSENNVASVSPTTAVNQRNNEQQIKEQQGIDGQDSTKNAMLLDIQSSLSSNIRKYDQKRSNVATANDNQPGLVPEEEADQQSSRRASDKDLQSEVDTPSSINKQNPLNRINHRSKQITQLPVAAVSAVTSDSKVQKTPSSNQNYDFSKKKKPVISLRKASGANVQDMLPTSSKQQQFASPNRTSNQQNKLKAQAGIIAVPNALNPVQSSRRLSQNDPVASQSQRGKGGNSRNINNVGLNIYSLAQSPTKSTRGATNTAVSSSGDIHLERVPTTKSSDLTHSRLTESQRMLMNSAAATGTVTPIQQSYSKFEMNISPVAVPHLQLKQKKKLYLYQESELQELEMQQQQHKHPTKLQCSPPVQPHRSNSSHTNLFASNMIESTTNLKGGVPSTTQLGDSQMDLYSQCMENRRAGVSESMMMCSNNSSSGKKQLSHLHSNTKVLPVNDGTAVAAAANAHAHRQNPNTLGITSRVVNQYKQDQRNQLLEVEKKLEKEEQEYKHLLSTSFHSPPNPQKDQSAKNPTQSSTSSASVPQQQKSSSRNRMMTVPTPKEKPQKQIQETKQQQQQVVVMQSMQQNQSKEAIGLRRVDSETQINNPHGMAMTGKPEDILYAEFMNDKREQFLKQNEAEGVSEGQLTQEQQEFLDDMHKPENRGNFLEFMLRNGNWVKEKQRKLKEQQAMFAQAQMKECTFKPVTNTAIGCSSMTNTAEEKSQNQLSPQRQSANTQPSLTGIGTGRTNVVVPSTKSSRLLEEQSKIKVQQLLSQSLSYQQQQQQHTSMSANKSLRGSQQRIKIPNTGQANTAHHLQTSQSSMKTSPQRKIKTQENYTNNNNNNNNSINNNSQNNFFVNSTFERPSRSVSNFVSQEQQIREQAIYKDIEDVMRIFKDLA